MDAAFDELLSELERRLLRSTGTLDPAVRTAAADGGPLPDPLGAYVDTVRRHAYRTTDQDIETLRAAGYTEDQLFEVTVAAAFGAARARLRAGLDAMATTHEVGRA
jgi:alkylhydroperoxidase family enzyme